MGETLCANDHNQMEPEIPSGNQTWLGNPGTLDG